ncbi:MAG: radical SAM protein [Methanocorpusculum sp.]|nr:radical SAM protein [Methanocorpusculum sp.]
MHYKDAKTLLSPKNGMNIYRGCTHGCIYCDSRSGCYHINHPFTDIEVKGNAPELLDKALARKKQKCMIGTGSMCDPYMPHEGELMLTRQCLEIIERRGFGVSIITKSDLILRDLDLLESINRKAKTVISVTLTTADENLCRIVEPDVCTTARRVQVLKILHGLGIPTIVWLCPILPFINDTEENLMGILRACKEAGVYGILCFGMGLTLRDGNREYFYQKLDEHFPGLADKYRAVYGNAYEIMSPRSTELMKLFYAFCRKEGIVCDSGELFAYMSEWQNSRQTTLF